MVLIDKKMTLAVIDTQNDFISGSLACINGDKAVKYIIEFIEENRDNLDVVYSRDWHKTTNHSFKINGGIWPIHCVQNSFGAMTADGFDLLPAVFKPCEANLFNKGITDDIEEYSAAKAVNGKGEIFEDKVGKEVIVAGIASEYCVLNSVRDFIAKGKKVFLLTKGLAYVTVEGHEKALEEMKSLGVIIL